MKYRQQKSGKAGKTEKMKGIRTQPFINCQLNSYNIYTIFEKIHSYSPPLEGISSYKNNFYLENKENLTEIQQGLYILGI